MKRWLAALLLIISLAGGLTACGYGSNSGGANTSSSSKSGY